LVIDLEIKRLATLQWSLCASIESLRKQQGKLARWQRRLVKKTKLSTKWHKIKAKINQLPGMIARCRKISAS
jgi:transposase